jgi:peptidoglycan hydrolase CwlO-like protein
MSILPSSEIPREDVSFDKYKRQIDTIAEQGLLTEFAKATLSQGLRQLNDIRNHSFELLHSYETLADTVSRRVVEDCHAADRIAAKINQLHKEQIELQEHDKDLKNRVKQLKEKKAEAEKPAG